MARPHSSLWGVTLSWIIHTKSKGQRRIDSSTANAARLFYGRLLLYCPLTHGLGNLILTSPRHNVRRLPSISLKDQPICEPVFNP